MVYVLEEVQDEQRLHVATDLGSLILVILVFGHLVADAGKDKNLRDFKTLIRTMCSFHMCLQWVVAFAIENATKCRPDIAVRNPHTSWGISI